MSDRWPIAISSGCCHRATMAEVLEAFERAGVDRMEVGTPPGHFDHGDPKQPWQIASAISRTDLTPIAIHAPFGPAVDFASERREHRDAGIKAAFAAARALLAHPGAIVVAHPSDLARDSGDTTARLRHALECLLLIDACCRDLGLRLAVETPLPHLVGGHPDELMWLLDRLPPSVGMCLDTGHAHLGRYIDAFIALAGPRLLHVHMHDNHGTHDDHLIPGRGAIDWCAVVDSLRRAHYAGALVIELACDRPSASYFREALEAARILCHAHAPLRLAEGAPG
jgi:sugar phosphate isomerase/epimerase